MLQPTQGSWYPPTALLPLQEVGVAQRQEEVGAGACDVETVLDGGGGGLYVFDGMGQEVVTVERVELELYTVEAELELYTVEVELELYTVEVELELYTVEVELELYTVEVGVGVEEEEETGGASHGSVDSRSVET